MRKNVVLIGGGDIATHYHVLLEDPEICLKALCDLNPRCPAGTLFREIPFLKDYHDYPDWNEIDYAIVAATAAAHFAIIRDLLKQGISVISEKPLAGSMDEVRTLYALADENGAELKVLFHWRYLRELMWLSGQLSALGPLKSIHISLYDDYAPGGRIRRDRVGMMGSWADCGINALSVVDLFLPAEKLRLTASEEVCDSTCGYPVYALRQYRCGSIPVSISVEWRESLRDKIFTIQFSRGDRIDILHRKGNRRQEVVRNGVTAAVFPTEDSLAEQYRIMFPEVLRCSPEENRAVSFRIHKALFS